MDNDRLGKLPNKPGPVAERHILSSACSPSRLRMNQQADSIRQGLNTPRAAAIAGIIFWLLLMVSMSLILTSIPPNPLAAVTDVSTHLKRISLAVDLLLFACISFLGSSACCAIA